MRRFQDLIKNHEGVALFLVLSSMAMLSIFVGEITYTAAVNQKLAYDRLDQVKAHALAKSGLKLALLRIKAYGELKRTMKQVEKSAPGAAGMIPKGILEKIWSEPVTIPFSGDLSGLPSEAKESLEKLRKDSGFEGKLYISIKAQSAQFNLNSILASFASLQAEKEKKKAEGPSDGEGSPNEGARGGTNPTPTPTPSATPVQYDPEFARLALTEQLRQMFQAKFEEDEDFRNQYRSFRIEDLSEDIAGWADLSFQSNREQLSHIPFKKAPFYDISELHYLPSMDDMLYRVLSSQFFAGVTPNLNVNTMTDPVLKGLLPGMTPEERKAFFEFRDLGNSDPSRDNSFKTSEDFFKYLQSKVALFQGSEERMKEFKAQLARRGIKIVTDESDFVIRIEATVQKTKKTLEAYVTLLPQSTGGNNPINPNQGANPMPQTMPAANPMNRQIESSNLRITQLRFL